MRSGRVKRVSIRMPEYMSHQRDRVEHFARNAQGLAPTSGTSMVGVLLARNGKSYIAHVRPRKWTDEKFWKGKIASLGFAQYFADAILHYCGKPRFHFKNVDFNFPPLDCIGTKVGVPERLTTTEQSFKYVEAIAGKDFVRQRQDFRKKVMRVIESADFILQGERFLNSREESAGPLEKLAALRDEAITVEEETAIPAEEEAATEEAIAFPAVEAARTDDNDDRADRETPMEEDDLGLDLANLVRGSASSQPTVAGFEFNLKLLNADVSEKILESVEQSLEPRHYNIYDCPAAVDEGWNKAIEELNKASAMFGTLSSDAGSSTAAVVSTSNAVENVSPNVYYMPPTVFEGVSFIPETKFVLVAPGEHVLSPGIARGNSEEKPSVQLAMTRDVQASSVDHPCGWIPGPLSCQASVTPVSRRPEVNTAPLMMSRELNHRTVTDKVQVQPSLMSTANLVLNSDVDFDSTSVYMTAEAKQLKNAKRQRIRD